MAYCKTSAMSTEAVVRMLFRLKITTADVTDTMCGFGIMPIVRMEREIGLKPMADGGMSRLRARSLGLQEHGDSTDRAGEAAKGSKCLIGWHDSS